ncbi:MAG: hypothetical protein OJF62_003127 [Pseudolabrys sp.]|jgi:hypothetical protein|nr:hypothetical protein [Pseudolabrys sp.]
MQNTVCKLVIASVLAAVALPPVTHAKSTKSVKAATSCQRVLGTWRMTSLGMSWTYNIKPGGAAVADDWNQMTWTCANGTVTLRNSLGANVRLTLQPDGNHMTGTETSGMAATAVRTGAPPPSTAGAPAAAKRGKHAAVAGNPARQRYCVAKWPLWRDAWAKDCAENADIGDLFTGGCPEVTREQFMAQCLAGQETMPDEAW